MADRTPPIHVLVHADESCLGNGTEPPNPGGNGALIEAPAGDSVARWDFYECSPDTTNNRMALAGAIARVPPLAVQPFERRDRTGQRHAIVGRVGGAFVKVPACDTVARGSFDQRAVAAGIGWLRAVAEAALVGMHEDVDRGRPVGHLRVGSPPGCRCGAGSPRRGTRRRRWGGRAGGSSGPRRTARRTGSA